MSYRRHCQKCGKTHFVSGGSCGAALVRQYPPESAERQAVSRDQLWAIVDAARVFLARSQAGRIGSDFYNKASERLEVELAILPEGAWRP